MKSVKSFVLIIFFQFYFAGFGYGQNYLYTNLKVPFLEYLAYTASQSNNDPNNTTAGLFFNAGYSVNFAQNFYTEIGFDYLIRSSVRNKLYNKTDLVNATAQFEAQNSAFAFQLKPLYKVSTNADENNFLTFGLGVNLQKLYSKGIFTNFNNNQNPIEEINI